MAPRGRAVQRLTVRVGGVNLAANTFVTFVGVVAGVGVKPMGVVEKVFNAGELADVITEGEAVIELAATLAAGATVASNVAGKAVASAANPIAGQLVEGGDSGDKVLMIVTR